MLRKHLVASQSQVNDEKWHKTFHKFKVVNAGIK
jgi:hypothetical protein